LGEVDRDVRLASQFARRLPVNGVLGAEALSARKRRPTRLVLFRAAPAVASPSGNRIHGQTLPAIALAAPSAFESSRAWCGDPAHAPSMQRKVRPQTR